MPGGRSTQEVCYRVRSSLPAKARASRGRRTDPREGSHRYGVRALTAKATVLPERASLGSGSGVAVAAAPPPPSASHECRRRCPPPAHAGRMRAPRKRREGSRRSSAASPIAAGCAAATPRSPRPFRRDCDALLLHTRGCWSIAAVPTLSSPPLAAYGREGRTPPPGTDSPGGGTNESQHRVMLRMRQPNSMRRCSTMSAAQQSLRADALLSGELAGLHEARAAMTAEAKATVCAVLSSLAQDPDLNPEIAAEARTVLEALLERPSPHLPRERGLRAARLRAA